MKKELIDQSAHFIAASVLVVLSYLALSVSPTLFGGLIGFSGGLIREITEDGLKEHDPVTSPGSMLDITFWTIGGTVSGAVISLFFN